MSSKPKTSGARGVTYEARVCMLAFTRGYIRGLKDFKLEYQVPEACKFDDIVFDEGGESYQIIQLKHKENANRISHANLFTEKFNTDYNLIKYVKAIVNANSTDRFQGKIKAAVVFTNIDFDLKNGELSLITNQRPNATTWYGGLKTIQLTPMNIENVDTVVNVCDLAPDAKYYTFNGNSDVVEILKRQAVTLVDEVGQLSEDQIRDALKLIIYAVKQPNDKELEEIIKNEIKHHFKLHSADAIYNELEKLFRDWCDTKDFVQQPSTSTQSNAAKQEILTYNEADEVFQKNVKRLLFGVTAPTASFTGRSKELEEIRNKLNAESNIIITQSLTISGLGGIGKTQLTKQFIKEFGQSEFYGRVIWIEAESDESVAKSFRQVAQKLNIENVRNKDTEVIIDDVFEFFEGFKVLFVFDNFDKNPLNEGSLVAYCRRIVSTPSNVSRPFFLFTSRNREILPGVPLLDLNVLSADDAVQLILRELTEIKLTREDAENLAGFVQNFPLALQQAIAFIKEHQKMVSVLGKTYEIKNYFKRFEEEKQELLDFAFPDEFGEYGKTTFITWNVTLDAIKADKKNGKNALLVLQMFAYLYADKLDTKMFLSLFQNNEKVTRESILLLEKYSMISKLEQESSFYQIHRLVQGVVQLKFKKNESKLLKITMRLVDPEIYKKYSTWHKKIFNKNKSLDQFKELMEKCTTDQIIHYNSLQAHMEKNSKMTTKYETFFEHLFSDNLFLRAALDDDLEKFKSFNLSKEQLQSFIEKNDDKIVEKKSYKIFKYLVENETLGVTELIIRNDKLIKNVTKDNEFDLFKYLVDKGANLTGILQFVSVDLLSEIKNGKIYSLQNLIKNQTDTNQQMLEECLFYATLLNQESIVELLIQNNIEPCYNLKNWSPLFIATKLNHLNIIRILVNASEKEQLKNCLFQLVKDESFTDKESFEIVFNEYIHKGGDVNVRDERGNSLLCHATSIGIRYPHVEFNVNKLEIIYFLLDNGANPTLKNYRNESSLSNTLEAYAHKNEKNSLEIKKLLDKMIFSNMTPDKFMNVVGTIFCTVDDWRSDQKLTETFERLVKQVGDINVRNEKGETVLIKHVQRGCKVKNVEFLVERGVGVDAIDNDGKSAFYYSVELEDFKVFEYLLQKVKSVDENFLLNAIKNDEITIVKKLFEKHFSPDHKFSDGKTPIEVATEYVSLQTLSYMKPQFIEYLDQGGDINERDEDGNTLLIKLVRARGRYDGDIDDVKFLVERGIDVNATNNRGDSALSCAVMLKKDDIFLYLVDKMSSVDENVLFDAILLNKLSIVKFLIPKHFRKDYRFINLNYSWKKYKNYTPLEVAIKMKSKDVENYLRTL